MEQEVVSVRFDVTIIHDPHMGVGSANSLKQLLFGILRILGIIQGDVPDCQVPFPCFYRRAGLS
jgi:hypothetical protein